MKCAIAQQSIVFSSDFSYLFRAYGHKYSIPVEVDSKGHFAVAQLPICGWM